MKKIFTIVFSILTFSVYSQVLFIGNDTTICPGSLTLTAVVNGISPPSVTMHSQPPPGIPNMGDDTWYGSPTAVPIGFNFTFFGNVYNQLYIGSNSVVTFTLPGSTFCPWSIGSAWPINLPPIIDAIGCPYQDLQPNVSTYGYIRSALMGTSPNRIFVIDWYDVPFYSCNSVCATQQIKLFETTNEVQIHITQRNVCATWNGGYGIEGLINSNGTLSYVPLGPPSRNYPSVWTCTNDAYSWTPTGFTTYNMTPCVYAPAYLGTFIPSSVTWYELGNPIPIGTGWNITVSPLLTTTYIATVSFIGSCNSPIFSDTITINVINSSINAGPDQTICSGNMTILHSTPGGYAYNWTPSVGLTSPNDSITFAFPNLTTTYYVTDSVLNCLNIDSVEIVVYGYALSTSSTNQNICIGDSVTVISSGSLNYNWSPSTWLNTSTNDTVVSTPLSSITYTITGTTPGCATIDTTITINILSPNVNLSSSQNPVCYNSSSVTLTGIPSGGIFSGPGVIGNTFITSLAPGNYNLIYTYIDPITTCIGYDTIVEVILPLPIVSIVNLNNSYCIDDLTVNLTGNPVGGIFKLDDITTNQMTPNANIGIHNIKYIYMDINGCVDSTLQVFVVNNLPIIDFVGLDTLYCPYDQPSLLIPNPNGGYFTSNIINDIFDPSIGSGNYNISYVYTDILTNCTNSIVKQTQVSNLPKAAFTFNPSKTTLADPSIHFINLSNLSDFNMWNFGDNNISQNFDVYHTYSDTGTYNIQLIVSHNGCLDTTYESLTIMPEFIFYIPSAFTPNGDLKNDEFAPKGLGISEFNMVIYDRWGNCLYQTNNINNPWKGDNYPNGVYIYKINVKDDMGKPYEYFGHVSIIF